MGYRPPILSDGSDDDVPELYDDESDDSDDNDDEVKVEFDKIEQIDPGAKQIILLSVDKTVPSGIMTRFVALAKGNGWGLGLKTSGKKL